MEEHVRKYVCPRASGTTVLVQQSLLADTVKRERAARETSSGLYTITDDSDQSFQVFCDFDSEPGFAWNLIQSFSLSKKDIFGPSIHRWYLTFCILLTLPFDLEISTETKL